MNGMLGRMAIGRICRGVLATRDGCQVRLNWLTSGRFSLTLRCRPSFHSIISLSLSLPLLLPPLFYCSFHRASVFMYVVDVVVVAFFHILLRMALPVQGSLSLFSIRSSMVFFGVIRTP